MYLKVKTDNESVFFIMSSMQTGYISFHVAFLHTKNKDCQINLHPKELTCRENTPIKVCKAPHVLQDFFMKSNKDIKRTEQVT